MTRISIRKHHAQYLELLAGQMNCNVTEALNYLLFEIRRQGFSFASALPATPPQPPTPIGAFTPFQELTPVTAPTAAPVIDPEPDEIIQKFVGLLEEF